MTAPPAVSVVLPVFRNGPTLPALHRRLVATLTGPLQPFEIIYVDDHSPDGSLEVMQALAAEDDRVRVIALDARGGQHAALAAGLRASMGQAVITMDADLQDPPEAIPRLVATLGHGFGAVYAGRRGHYQSIGRLVTSRAFKGVMSLLVGMPDDAGAFIAMRRDVAHRAAALPGRAPYVPAAVALAGRPVVSIPVVRERRDGAGSSYTSGLRARTAARAIGQALRWRLAGVARVTRNAPGRAARIAAAAAVAALAALFSTTHGVTGTDGTWVLQVVSRLRAGDVLYRDVFFGVPPLAVGVASAATRVLGLELVALRLLVAVVIALSYLAAAATLRRITGSRRYDLVLAPMILAWALPANVSLYQPLANLFLLLGWAAVARWACPADEEAAPPAGVLLVLAGAAAGLSWGAKQTTGTFAIMGVLAVIAIEHRRRRAPITPAVNACALAILAFAGSLLLLLAPVAASGGWDKFLEYGFFNKTTYMRVAGLSFVDQLAAAVRASKPGPRFILLESVKAQPFLLTLLLPPAALVLLARRPRASMGTVLAIGLALSEAATLVPRPDTEHLVTAMPGLLVVLLSAWHVVWPRRSGRWKGVAEACCLLVVAAAVVVRAAASSEALESNAYVWSSMPHLRLVLLPRAREAALLRAAGSLRGAATDGSLFVLAPNAGLYYLVSGLRNPTPFDYPLITAFGRTGQADVASSIAQGSLGRVCMAPVRGPLAPARLQIAVRGYLFPGPDLGVCTVYQREK